MRERTIYPEGLHGQPESNSAPTFLDGLRPGDTILQRTAGNERVNQRLWVADVSDWDVIDMAVRKKIVHLHGILEGPSKGDMTVQVVKDFATGSVWVEDEQGVRIPEFDGDIEILSPHDTAPPPSATRPRNQEEMRALLEDRELHKTTVPVFDESGRPLGEIDYAVDGDRIDVIAVRTVPSENVEQTAEKPKEHIYLTNEQGNVIPERATRAEARASDKRYLVVTTLIFHGAEVLLQHRSSEKEIDAGRISSSAHGVAKEVFTDQGKKRVNNTDIAATVNSALETNEELRHGAAPFSIQVWPGTKDELFAYAEKSQINDPNTVYMVPEALIGSGGYPLGSTDAKRTRAISTGFIFSQDAPEIHIDPAELSATEWKRPSTFVDDSQMTQDLQACVDTLTSQHIRDTQESGVLGAHLARKALTELISGKRGLPRQL
ncbi:MAG: hypothetical protein A2898_01575 [Candidatus Kerfeldbacteria bacterium RIFCSPLOWO2_01_FULL_48_11]|uniref:Uncharacterized protein n=1 Tax=Candidatus Kerfeldbacteria bacterium RIFCSPLOWO2_01_FULL_48_11 TaxID=1798543 RepID=A0A1G2B6U6_9BACT|nr:MAG: hypothetical protein UY34_C0010G0059 [Parcubacteria group bacterium GW2011_GWA2_48_9]OGY83947.1 MAG: hypothetical protein A2898_01575 [Candidatus Kerfeldbacteria bacterium RIFCSPLOWO2_01_FULL_48_11]HCM67381.1 hypothetical protein [Candidatus Kerfeldbacteria bacterium]